MSEVLQIQYKVTRNPDVGFHALFWPSNVGIEGATHHGADLPDAQSVEAYLPTARAQILDELNRQFPNAYK